MSKETAEILTKALDELNKRGHHKGRAINEQTGAVCAIGAVHFAAHAYNELEAKRLRLCAEQALMQRLPAPYDFVHRYNDAPETTEEDIKLLFKHAIAAEEETE